MRRQLAYIVTWISHILIRVDSSRLESRNILLSDAVRDATEGNRRCGLQPLMCYLGVDYAPWAIQELVPHNCSIKTAFSTKVAARSKATHNRESL